ncbi:MAG: DUF3160 domain-containing protein [Anaerolineae bacterium]|nr:DUF3160 domain-containing protein [Anaerolineae bacterium]
MQPHRHWFLTILFSVALIAGALAPAFTPAARAQGECGSAPAPRLVAGGAGMVTFTDGRPLNVRNAAGLSGTQIGQLPEGTTFAVVEGPVCADSIYWWHVTAGALTGWIAEGMEGEYFVAPSAATTPQGEVTPAGPVVPLSQGTGPFTVWDWATFAADSWYGDQPDPMQIAPPDVYSGDLPGLPVDLSGVMFLEDAGLSQAQLALLAQNGFVVVPGGLDQFYPAYRDSGDWQTWPEGVIYDGSQNADLPPGHAFFITTDATLHALHFIFDNLLTDLEKASFYPLLTQNVVTPALQAAHAQTQAAAGTALESPARSAELFLAVALELLAPGNAAPIVGAEAMSAVTPLVEMALAAQGQLDVPFLTNYQEDFSQYRPRGHYDGDPVLEQYFRGMMWLSRITFLAEDPQATQIALLLLRALRSSPEAIAGWTTLHETLTFLIGPMDDLGPTEYSAVTAAIYHPADLPLDALADPERLAAFQAMLKTLPGPRINGLILPDSTAAGEMSESGRGFRFLGQRFTLDGYVMDQLMYPYVGTRENPRLLPLSLDVAAAVGGAEMPYSLAVQAGAGDFLNYDAQVLKLASELGVLGDQDWLENTYGAWLWTLKPLWGRDPAGYPPLMQTEAWLRKDLQTGLASWTELKHDTVLYAKQPSGLGGGGAPLTSFGYVEPNPLVFARIAVVAALTHQGLTERGLVSLDSTEYAGFQATLYQLRGLAYEAAQLAEIARKELAGEPRTEDEYWTIFGFGQYLWAMLITLSTYPDNPDPVALVTDVASNPSAQIVLQEAVGNVDYIYMVAPVSTGGWQLLRGGVFTYYEWVGNINERMTDAEWRAQVAAGDLPPRPAWVSAFYAE